ncbi:MAG: 30S ribosomal protein S20, partial [Saprospiraceae bacterium]
MAHHKSAKKRIRQDAKKRIQNRYYKKSARTNIKNLRE